MSDSLYHSPPFDFIKNKIFALDDSSDIVNDMPSYSDQNMSQDYNDVEGQNEENTQEETDQKKYSKVNEKSKKLNEVNDNLVLPIAESISPLINKNSLSSKNNTNSLLNQKRGNESKNQSNSNKNINGLNQSKAGENKKKGRLTKNSGKEGKHNKFSSDNMIKKSINSSLKIMIDASNKISKKKEIYKELKAILNKYDKIFLNIKNEFTKENTKEMMEKSIGEIIYEKKIYKNYKNKDENYIDSQ